MRDSPVMNVGEMFQKPAGQRGGVVGIKLNVVDVPGVPVEAVDGLYNTGSPRAKNLPQPSLLPRLHACLTCVGFPCPTEHVLTNRYDHLAHRKLTQNLLFTPVL